MPTGSIFRVPSPIETAIAQVEIFGRRREGEYRRIFGEILAQGKIVGPKVHDARIAAICRADGIRELWSADRDFSRIRGVKVTNPVLHFTR
jgi:uncharacterized protein